MIGTGYVGLVSGYVLNLGNDVICVDKDKKN